MFRTFRSLCFWILFVLVSVPSFGAFSVQLKEPGGAPAAGFTVAVVGRPGTVLTDSDGRFTLDSKGRLVTAAEGLAVLDSSRSPITLDPSAGPVTVDADGTIRQRGSSVARVGLVDFADRSRLKKEGGGTFSVPASVLSSAQPGTGDVLQKMVEKSNVDAVQAMMQVTNASNDAQGATRLMSMYDEMLNRAINTLGRVT